MTDMIPTLGERYEFGAQDGVWVLTCWTCEVTIAAWQNHPDEGTRTDCAITHEEESHCP